MDFENEYSNATDVKVENIPPNVLDDLAALFYNIFTRLVDEKQNKETAAAERNPHRRRKERGESGGRQTYKN